MKLVPVIDHGTCIQCGKCMEICPTKILKKVNGLVTPMATECLLCSHCYSLCPVGAIGFHKDLLRKPRFRTFDYKEEMLPQKVEFQNMLINHVRSRRSVRKYTNEDITDNILNDLLEFAVTAPSGTNSQDWEFIIINGKEKVRDLGIRIQDYFEKLNRMVKNPVLRSLASVVKGKAVTTYYRDHMDSVEFGISEFKKGNDLLFHHAPALIILHSKKEGSTPREDAQYAAYNITLLAPFLGLGTCFIGFAEAVINRSKDIQKYLGVPADHMVNAVLTVGYSGVVFERNSLRKNYKVTYK